MLNVLAPVQVPHILTLNTDFRPSLRDYVTMLTQAPYYLEQLRYSAPLFVPAHLFRHAFLRFDRIICWTGFLHDKLLSLGIPAEKLARIPVGIDVASLDLQGKRDSGGSPLFLYSGALSRLRGIAVLMHAFRIVKDVEAGARLVIADRGPHTVKDLPMHAHELRHLSRQIDDYGLRDSVTRSEFGGDLSDWTNVCHAVVLPFNTTIGYTQPPLTLLEAMAHGKPVISTRIGSIPEHIRDGVSGLVVEPGNAEGLAKAMLELTPENSRRMGRNARVQIETNHSWEQVVERTEAIYSSTLSP
jgi:glycosyltransferase involved in cell wall biosynthesis